MKTTDENRSIGYLVTSLLGESDSSPLWGEWGTWLLATWLLGYLST